MTKSDVQTALEATYPKELIESLLRSYENALAEYKKGHWQYFGNDRSCVLTLLPNGGPFNILLRNQPPCYVYDARMSLAV